MRLPLPAVARRRSFPYGAPSWPGGVLRPPVERTTGVDYETDWARRYGPRLARSLIVDDLLKPLVGLLAAPRVHGLDRIDTLEGAAIFAANHHSHLDTPLLLTALPERFRHRAVVAAAADYFFKTRSTAAISALAIGAIPMERTKVGRRSADLAARLLEDGWSLVIFPEGGRSPDGWGRAFRGGAAYLSLRCDRPVVPVHIEGTRGVWKRGARVPSPAGAPFRRVPATHVTFGSPIQPEPGEDARRFAARIENAVAVLADEWATDWWSARRRAGAGTTPSLGAPGGGAWRRSWALGRARSTRQPRSEHTWP